MLERIWAKYWRYRLLVKCRRNYVINKDEGIWERESESEGRGKQGKI